MAMHQPREGVRTVSGTRDKIKAPRWSLVFRGDPPRVVPLVDGGSYVVGRADPCDVRVDDLTVSRLHARLTLDDDALLVEDIGSRNGTRVDGERLDAGIARPVDRACTVSFGSVLATIACSDARPRAACDPTRVTDGQGSLHPFEDWADGPVVADAKMIELYLRVDTMAKSTLSAHVRGETGVGKELVAEAIHRCSPRASQRIAVLNCAGLPESMIDAELFGYERGAFTGATASKPGLIEAAHLSTLFLDEIADMTPATQAKLLRALERGEVRRLGSVQTRTVDVRFVSATNRDLARMVEEGTFRRDLYFRLTGFVLDVPPLRHRKNDVAALADHFLARAAAKLGRRTPELAPEAIAALEAHDWPGNVRELRMIVERALVLCPAGDVRAEHLVRNDGRPLVAHPTTAAPLRQRLRERVLAEERDLVVAALRRTNGHQGRAAQLLGISRRGLINKLDAFGIERPRKSLRDGE